jgi:amino acid transporter
MDTEKSIPSEPISIPETGHVINPILNCKYGHTHRGLSSRHVQLIALGGSIGTGLFIGVGSVLSSSGPASIFLAFCLYSLPFIWPCNMAVGEMATYLPMRGSVYHFVSRYIDEALGFSLGWTYFYGSSMTFCAELSAVATIIQFCDAKTNLAVWIALGLVVDLALHVFAVK